MKERFAQQFQLKIKQVCGFRLRAYSEMQELRRIFIDRIERCNINQKRTVGLRITKFINEATIAIVDIEGYRRFRTAWYIGILHN